MCGLAIALRHLMATAAANLWLERRERLCAAVQWELAGVIHVNCVLGKIPVSINGRGTSLLNNSPQKLVKIQTLNHIILK